MDETVVAYLGHDAAAGEIPEADKDEADKGEADKDEADPNEADDFS
jgi:hypothetical protein